MTHAQMMDEYYAARAAWEAQTEAATLGYATERASYVREHPPVTFKEWLRQSAQPRPELVAAR